MSRFFDSPDTPSLDSAKGKYKPNIFPHSMTAPVVDVIHDMGKRSAGDIIVTVTKGRGEKNTVACRPDSPFMFACPLPNETVCATFNSSTKEWHYSNVYPVGTNINYMGSAKSITKTRDIDNNVIPYTGQYFRPYPNSARMIDVFEGDVVLQGRFGHSIRFSGTNPDLSQNATWKSGRRNEATAITIIRNGYAPIENLNVDSASIYLITDQYIPIPLKATLPPDLESTKDRYGNGQVLLFSDRIVIGTKHDEVIINSASSIELTTPEWQGNVDTIMNTLEELVGHVKTLATEMNNTTFALIGQTFTVPGVGMSGPSTRVADFSSVYAKVSTVQSQLMTIEQQIGILRQKQT